MPHPVIHAEIRSGDPDATRAFFADLFGWTYADGGLPGYTFVGPGVEDALPTAIGPLQGGTTRCCSSSLSRTSRRRSREPSSSAARPIQPATERCPA